MKKTGIAVLLVSVAAAFAAPAAYEIPEAWRAKPFAGGAAGDFLMMAPVVYPRQTNGFEDAVKRYRCISDMTRTVRFLPKRAKDGSFTYDLSTPVPEKDPFAVVVYPRVSVYPRDVLFNPVRHDMDAYRKWLAEHPNFIGFMSCEFFNDITMPLRPDGRDHMKRHIFSKDRTQIITDEEMDGVCRRPEYLGAFGNPQEITTNLVAKYIARLIEMQFGDAKHAMIGEGTFCVNHLAAYGGAGMIGIETTRNYRPYQILEMFCRGTARQFGIPWYWYIASYFHGYHSDGRFFPSCYRTARKGKPSDGPNFGLSLSAIERTMWKAWLSGAGSYEREAMIESIFETDVMPWKLSDEGEVYARFYDVVKNNDRGTPYTPVALLVPAARGASRQLGRAYLSNMKCAYTHPDHMTDAVIASALDFAANMKMSAMKEGVERVMCNSKYGDLFDAVTPDFEDQTTFRRVLPSYPCAILCGEYGENRELRDILRGWVENGGTLVLSSAQLRTFPVDMASLKPLANPKFLEARTGKGRVIVGSEPYLTAWEGKDEADAAKRSLAAIDVGEPRRFADIEWLLDELSRRFAPVTVKGDVQWGLNRTDEGWLFWCINNAGVIKFADKHQVIKPGGSALEVDVSRLGISSARDILSGKAAEVSGGRLRTVVPYGGTAIYRLK